MAVVNRYTQTKDSVYQPMTLQELMVAPAYKRQKHDELDASIAEYETELAKFDSLAEHSEALKAEQDKLYQNMLAQRDKLNEEGFSKSAKSNFLKFNKEYQSTVGPQGSIGKIQKAMKSYKDFETQMLATAAQQGHDVSEAQKRLAEQREGYKKKFLETGEIEDFQGVLPPSYHDLEKDIKDVRQQLGYELKQSNLDLADYNLSIDYSTGIPQLMLVSKQGKELTKNNNSAVAYAEKYLVNKWLNEKGEGYQSAVFNGMDKGNIEEAIKNGLGMQRFSEDISEIDTRVSMKDLPTLGNPSGKSSEPEDLSQKVTADISRSSSFFDARGVDSVERLDELIIQLQNGTDSDQAKARALKNRKHIIEREYRNKPNGEVKEFALDYDRTKQTGLNAYEEATKETGGIFTVQIYPGDPRSTVQDYEQASHDEIMKVALSNKLIGKEDENGVFSIIEDVPGADNRTLMKGGQSVKNYYQTLKENKQIISVYNEGLNEKLKFEKMQDVKSKITSFKNDSERDHYNNTMLKYITDFPSVFKARLGVLDKDNSGKNQRPLTEEEIESVTNAISSGGQEGQANFEGFIMSTENGVPAVEVNYKDKDGKLYVVQYELTDLTGPSPGLRGATKSMLDTFAQYGGVEADALRKKFEQSIDYKDFQPTFFEDDFSNSQRVKNEIIGRVSTPEELESSPYGYTIADALDSNGLLSGDIDISARSYNNTQYYSAKIKDPKTNEIRNLTYADLVPSVDGNKDFRNIAGNSKIANIIIPAMQNQLLRMGIIGYTLSNNGQDQILQQVRDITDSEAEELLNILKNSEIRSDNHYDILDVLKQK